MWDSSSGKEIMKMEGHTEAVNCCQFTPDDKYVISCSADKSIKVITSFSFNSNLAKIAKLFLAALSPNDCVVSGQFPLLVVSNY